MHLNFIGGSRSNFGTAKQFFEMDLVPERHSQPPCTGRAEPWQRPLRRPPQRVPSPSTFRCPLALCWMIYCIAAPSLTVLSSCGCGRCRRGPGLGRKCPRKLVSSWARLRLHTSLYLCCQAHGSTAWCAPRPSTCQGQEHAFVFCAFFILTFSFCCH